MGGLAFWILGLSRPLGTAMAFLLYPDWGRLDLGPLPSSCDLGLFHQGIILLIIGVFGISLVDRL
jgi:hypothetical protein